MDVRLDKWLAVARIFKTRSKAGHACDLGRVKVNGFSVKAHRKVALEDRIEVDFGDWERHLIVKELRDKSVRKEMAKALYEDVSPPRPQLDPVERLWRRPMAVRERGAGRPTKKQRREMERITSESE